MMRMILFCQFVHLYAFVGDMYGLLLQIHLTLCTFVLSIRFRVVIHSNLGLG